MAIYNFYIFDRLGRCIHYAEWLQPRQMNMDKEQEFQLLHGLLTSIRSFDEKISPLGAKSQFKSFATSKNRLHYFETLTSLKFVINTDLQAIEIDQLLAQIYAEVYVPYVTGNPVSMKNGKICSRAFEEKLDNLIQNHSSSSLHS